MKCPFELPVRTEKRLIIAKNERRLGTCGTQDEADYIVQAINSHEKLVEYARHKKDCRKGCRIIMSKEKEGCTCGFEQALKEEKSK